MATRIRRSNSYKADLELLRRRLQNVTRANDVLRAGLRSVAEARAAVRQLGAVLDDPVIQRAIEGPEGLVS